MKRLLKGLFAAGVIFAWSSLSLARVFDFAQSTGAPYFAGSYGQSQLRGTPFTNEVNHEYTTSADVAILSTGELGYVYSTSRFNFLVGLELFNPQKTSGINVSQNATSLYGVSTLIQSYAYKVGVEAQLRKAPQSRSFVGFQYGMLSLTQKNTYTLTGDGQTAFPGVNTHTTESKGSGTLYSAYLGHESIFSDTVSLFANLGYREARIDSLTYTAPITTFTGSKTSGQKVKDLNDRMAALDFSGVYVQLGFRFYF